MKGFWSEFAITVVAIVAGLVAGKYASRALAQAGVPIAAGNPIPVPPQPKGA